MEEDVSRQRQEKLERQLKNIRSRFGAEKTDELVEVLNRLRDGVLDGAEGIAGKNPEQLQRFSDSVLALARSMKVIAAANARPVRETITRLRQAVMDIGLGKFVNPRTGNQEKPEE